MPIPFGRRCGLVLAFAFALSPLAQAQQPLDIIVARVQAQEIANQIEALGTLYANETAVLAANITETITEINFEDGQRVRQGHVLVSLANREQLAQLEEAKAALADAERQLDRSQQLARSNALAQQDLDARRREVDISRARLRAVEARLADRLIRAPFDSVVGLRQVSVGTLLTPGTAVATLHDDRQMKLDFSIPELKLGQVTPGQQVTATTRAFPGQVFEGEVAVLDNQVDPVTRSVRVRALLPNPDGLLRPGMLMSTRVASDPRKASVIPEEALLPQGSQQFVMLVDEGSDAPQVSRQAIRIGERLAGAVEVLEGLEPGQLVVTHGNFRVQPGQPVRIKAEQMPGQSVDELLSTDAE
jgi:membrane fusion protein, multidrug efflux system